MRVDFKANAHYCSAVTAIYKGTSGKSSSRNGNPTALLRSYDSRKEPAPEFECTIWQAGRATAATGLAFKPIQIGQSVFLDEGVGKYNPSPQVLDEAVCNEWPGREVGVFISIGTGKRPNGTNDQRHLWWEGFVGGSVGAFAEARSRLISKIEACEETHKHMLHKHLHDRNVNPENYYRFNVEVGVGEFGMNEWGRLSEISTSTRMYLAKQDVQAMNMEASAKMARIVLAKRRHDRHVSNASTVSYQPSPNNTMQPSRYDAPLPDIPPPANFAVELPAEDVLPMQPRALQYQHMGSIADMKYTVTSSDDYPPPLKSSNGRPYSQQHDSPRHSDTSVHSYSSSSHQQRHSSVDYRTSSMSSSEYRPTSGHRTSPPLASLTSAPPLPPKTPLPYPDGRDDSMRRWEMGSLKVDLPYPEADGPPPPVNVARKPEFGVSR